MRKAGRGLIAVILVTTAVSWATTSPASTSMQNSPAREVVPFEVTARDGTKLRGHVYLPYGRGPYATVLEYSPYWNNLDGPSSTPEDDGPGRVIKTNPHVERLLREGFAFAAVSLRGTGSSGGCHQWGGKTEWHDAATVVEALAQKPWSTGKIGMIGLSYSGWTQYEAIAANAPALKAAVPASGVIDLWSLMTRHGAPISGAQTVQTAFTAITTTPVFGDVEPEHANCPRFAEEVDAALTLSIDAAKTPYFEERDLRQEIAGTKVAVFASNGMTDNEGHILQFEGLWDLLGPQKRLHLFQGPHAYPTREDFLDQAVGWLDRHLRGGRDATRSGIVEYEDDSGRWHVARSWPPRAQRQTLFLSGDELTSDASRIESSERSFRTGKHPCLEVCGAKAPGSTYLVECASGNAAYMTPPLTEDVLVAGNFTLDLKVRSDQPGGYLAAMLYHAPAGAGCPVFEGVEVRRALMDLRHWKQEGRPEPFPIDQVTKVGMTSHPLASAIPAGHRLILVLAGDSDELHPSPYRPELSFSTSPTLPSSLSLPIVEGNLNFARRAREGIE